MAMSSTVSPSDGLLPVTLLEIFAGLLFLGFILLSVSIMIGQKMPMMAKKDLENSALFTASQPNVVPIVADAVVDGMADRLVERLDRNFRIRDDRLGRMIVGLGDKLDYMKDSKEVQWSQLRRDINEKLEMLVQEAALQGPKFDSARVMTGGLGSRVQVAQETTSQVPIINDAMSLVVMATTEGDAGKTVAEVGVTEEKTEPMLAAIPVPKIVEKGDSSVSEVKPLETTALVAQAIPVEGVPAVVASASVPLEAGIFNPPPTEAQKRGIFISLGCFSQANNALERGHKVRPFAPLIYRKIIRNGEMSCVFSGPYSERSAAKKVLGRINEGTGISGFSLGSY